MTFLRALTVGSALAIFLAPASAQTYPDKPIRIVIPLAAGSTTDALVRTAAPKMSAMLGVPVVIENLPGAGGALGSTAVAKAQPDGYTLLIGASGAFSVNPHINKSLAYNPVKDFAPVCRMGGTAYVLAVNPQLGPKNLPELLALAKSRSLSFASSGVGSSPHMAQELFKSRVGAPFVHVPYKGAPQAISDTVGGHADLMMEAPIPLLSTLRSGKLLAIGITSRKRSPALPDVPTFEELGYPGLVLQGWVGLVAPTGTPSRAIDLLSEACLSAMATPEVRAQGQQGFDIDVVGPAEFGPFIASELVKWGELVKQSGMKPE